ncbi:hypothetical protein HGB47_07535 [Leptospira yasudae]|uniref:hypothetical protein n=1 Tax=Leptospira yasudae TaxID=2202201 RepID=UPI001C4F7D75|nr:hypothetical protein [Leptospira yasudae]MBW0433466.1 hypothetical protein [Leptospira yasudae]
MKAKILGLLIALFAVGACTTGSSSTHGNGYQYSAGSYYVIQEAKIDYTDAEKNSSAGSFSKNPLRIYLDLVLAPLNLVYYAFTDETIFGTYSNSSDNVSLEEESSAQQYFEFKTSLLKNDPEATLVNAEDGTKVDASLPARIYLDLVIFPINIVVYFVSDDTLFGSLSAFGVAERARSNRAELARDVLTTATVKKQIASSDRISNFLDITNVSNFLLSLWGSGKGKADVGAFETKPYFTSDKIMNRFDAETFGQLLTDANLVLDDLDLSAEDVEELKQNGYLDFVEDDAKSIPTFEAAPVKGKKK